MRVEEVQYLPQKAKEEPVTSAGTRVSNFVSLTSKHCFFIAPVRFCEYFPLGLECKFCNFNDTQEKAHSIGLERSTTINLEETLEAYKIMASETRFVEGRFECGGHTRSEQEARIHANFVGKIAAATSYKPNITVHAQPMDRNDMQRLRDTGVDSMCFQMEIWDPDLFPEVVPGKARYTGRERYLEAFQEAVDIFGVGSVGCVFVGGLTLIPENGHKTWQEARDSMIEGNSWMIRHGVLPGVTPLRLPPGAPWGSAENRKKYPPTDYYLDVALAHHQVMLEHGRYDKMNKLMWCPIECLTNRVGIELGVYEVAGSLANWTADCVPREANWHLDWEEQRKSLASVK
ncbi:MAG: hypothetical protein Q7O66_20420 [Dehalococcoidia bacterium]|nr:hypothetical protein [Dehalococcoidia bacterium]